ncbi:MAG: c-type cytochrome [Planctomycetes bacterium]|nr:c-type cytochrome [Planctomycetota bacterium]
MTRWVIVAAVALGLIALFSNDAQAQKKKGKPVDDAIHDPAVAVKNLDVHPDLQATLFVSEPKITNPTNLDIDHRGRVWICDVKNYRGHRNSRPEGDRILILEDTKGTGVADKVTTFYQGRDVDSAMGICVLGNKVIVSASPNVLVFTFDENDKITKKEVLFSKTGVSQHDHTAHSFVFGPDGRLYWNFGNEGHAVHEKDGKPVVDLAGNVVNDKGNPYRQGMVFRCEMDGSNFETLGWNFRNNYEVAVDSFGTMWQSDNDDDGNKGVRINYVMEFLLQTGAGSPTGICVYEGTLLSRALAPRVRPDSRSESATLVVHCDALPNVVRCYPAVPDGAGYKVPQIVNILDGAKKNNWFRPADVCVAPDGSIFVTDWYDPGVGGHAQGDKDRGRVFRVAPPGVNYSLPKYNFDTIAGNIEALKSPNLATRYIAWTNLHKEGAKAEAALLKLYESKVPHERARALWLLGRIEGKGPHYVDKAIADKDANIRIVGIRLARQLKFEVTPVLTTLRDDRDAAVRRECAVALRPSKSNLAALQWMDLAASHDGIDRWYLEALGIGADKNWNACLEHYMQKGPARSLLHKPTRDIVWRSRADVTPTLLATAISFPQVPTDELPRLFRAFDFQKDSDIKNEALVKLAFGTYADPARAKLITTEAINRLKTFDINKNPAHAAALDNLLDQSKGTTAFVEMVGKFNVAKRYPELLALAQKQPTEQIGVDAIRVLFERDQVKLIQTGLASSDKALAASTAQAISGAGHDKANALLLPIIRNDKLDLELRRQATRALARNQTGARALLQLAESRELSKELYVAAGSVLNVSTSKDIREIAARLFPPPTTKDKKPLPAISDLVKMKGNTSNGASVFAKAGACAKCHQVNGEGKNVGPDLSEIGKKLAREALYESILYPSASIAHNFETWVVETKKGTTANGLLVSKTAEEISIKDAESIVRTFKMTDVESATKSAVSLMPADLHQLMTTQEMVDVVEYLATLKEARKK